MNNQSFFATLWQIVLKGLDFDGKSGRQEYIYSKVFQLSLFLAYVSIILIMRDSTMPTIHEFLSKAAVYKIFVVMLVLLISWLSGTFRLCCLSLFIRRCRDVGIRLHVAIPLGCIPLVRSAFICFLMVKKGVQEDLVRI